MDSGLRGRVRVGCTRCRSNWAYRDRRDGCPDLYTCTVCGHVTGDTALMNVRATTPLRHRA